MARAMVVRTDGPRRATRSTLEERARASVRTVAAAVRPVGPSQRMEAAAARARSVTDVQTNKGSRT
eukprot:scaffold3986_cov105-Isochrysis_galbana.AAC.1